MSDYIEHGAKTDMSFEYWLDRLLSIGVSENEIRKAPYSGITYKELYERHTKANEKAGAGPLIDDSALLSCFASLDTFEEQPAKWLVPGWIPAEQISLLAAEGGLGKTSMWIEILAAMSSGRRCVLDPEDLKREPVRVAFLTTEDSVRKKLKRKLIDAGAVENNVLTADLSSANSDLLRGLKFGSPELAMFVRHFRPAVCVFDPVQGFVPADVNMCSRNAMRDCLAPLVALGEETGTTSLVICHTNKRKGASGRDRIADSADLWDISRSVLMCGYTQENGIRYISNEKNNYDVLQQTILFSIDDKGLIHREGTTWKRDRDFAQEHIAATAPSTRQSAAAFIEDKLREGSCRISTLYDLAAAAGYSSTTMRRAIEGLDKAGKVRRWQTGYGSGKLWQIECLSPASTEQPPIEGFKVNE